MNDFINIPFTAISIAYLIFILDMIIKAWRQGNVERWKLWLLASCVFNTMSVWTSGALHWLIVTAWLFCVAVFLYLLWRSWQAMKARQAQLTQEIEILQAQIVETEQRIEALSILTTWPKMRIDEDREVLQ